MKKLYISLIALFTLSFNFVFAAESYEDKTIANIEVTIENPDSQSSFDSKTILTRLKTQKGEKFSQSAFDSDLKILYADFDKIEPSISLQNNEVYIKLKLWIKPVIRNIEWHGNEHIKTKTLQKELGINVNSTFDRHLFNKALTKVKEYYIKKGYFESQIDYRTNINEKNEVFIDVNVFEGKSGIIKKIIFKGFTKNEKSDLLEMVYTKKYNLLTSWFSGAGTFKEEVLEQDKMTIMDYLHNKGYADAKVDITINEEKDNDKIIIEITAHRGTLYRFGKITYEGNTLLSNDEVLNCFLVHPDETFSPAKVRETAQSIKDAYGEKGYIDTQVNYDTHLMENEPVYKVDFQIEEGECFKIGYIKVFGNCSTRTNVILRESLLIPGETFDSRKLKGTQQRLENLGYFKNVNVFAVQSNEASELGDNYRDVIIEVEETQTGNIQMFAGFSSMENVFGGLELNENNFDHRGIFTLFSKGPSGMRGGGEFLKMKATIGKREQNYSLTWMTPYFKDTLWRLGTELSGTESQLTSKDYTVRTYGGSLFTSYPITRYWSWTLKYRLRNSINHMSPRVQHDVERGNNKKRDEEVENSEGLISAMGASFGYDSTDRAYKPRQGLRSYLEGEFVGLGGKYHFYKYAYINTYYYPIWNKGTFKYRGDLKFIQPTSSLSDKKIPMSERFFLGGEESVRGYKTYVLGPRLPSTDQPRGGVSSLLLSIEYAQEIFKQLDLFAFADAGSVRWGHFNLPKLRASCGVGARLEISYRMPITVGWGYAINPRYHDDRQPVFFSMGGQF